jgi:hypothetical protein
MAMNAHAAFEKMLDGFTHTVRSLPASDRTTVLERWRRSFYVLGAQEGLSDEAIEEWLVRVETAVSRRSG